MYGWAPGKHVPALDPGAHPAGGGPAALDELIPNAPRLLIDLHSTHLGRGQQRPRDGASARLRRLARDPKSKNCCAESQKDSTPNEPTRTAGVWKFENLFGEEATAGY